MWLAHTVITEYLGRANSVLVRLNLLMLMLVSFIPFPTRLVAEYIRDDEPERVAVTAYGFTFLLTSLVVSALWRYSVRAGLVRPDAADDEVRMLTTRLSPSLAGYVAMIGLGLVLPVVAVVGYLALAVYVVAPFRSVRRGLSDP